MAEGTSRSIWDIWDSSSHDASSCDMRSDAAEDGIDRNTDRNPINGFDQADDQADGIGRKSTDDEANQKRPPSSLFSGLLKLKSKFKSHAANTEHLEVEPGDTPKDGSANTVESDAALVTERIPITHDDSAKSRVATPFYDDIVDDDDEFQLVMDLDTSTDDAQKLDTTIEYDVDDVMPDRLTHADVNCVADVLAAELPSVVEAADGIDDELASTESLADVDEDITLFISSDTDHNTTGNKLDDSGNSDVIVEAVEAVGQRDARVDVPVSMAAAEPQCGTDTEGSDGFGNLFSKFKNPLVSTAVPGNKKTEVCGLRRALEVSDDTIPLAEKPKRAADGDRQVSTNLAKFKFSKGLSALSSALKLNRAGSDKTSAEEPCAIKTGAFDVNADAIGAFEPDVNITSQSNAQKHIALQHDHVGKSRPVDATQQVLRETLPNDDKVTSNRPHPGNIFDQFQPPSSSAATTSQNQSSSSYPAVVSTAARDSASLCTAPKNIFESFASDGPGLQHSAPSQATVADVPCTSASTHSTVSARFPTSTLRFPIVKLTTCSKSASGSTADQALSGVVDEKMPCKRERRKPSKFDDFVTNEKTVKLFKRKPAVATMSRVPDTEDEQVDKTADASGSGVSKTNDVKLSASDASSAGGVDIKDSAEHCVAGSDNLAPGTAGDCKYARPKRVGVRQNFWRPVRRKKLQLTGAKLSQKQMTKAKNVRKQLREAVVCLQRIEMSQLKHLTTADVPKDLVSNSCETLKSNVDADISKTESQCARVEPLKSASSSMCPGSSKPTNTNSRPLLEDVQQCVEKSFERSPGGARMGVFSLLQQAHAKDDMNSSHDASHNAHESNTEPATQACDDQGSRDVHMAPITQIVRPFLSSATNDIVSETGSESKHTAPVPFMLPQTSKMALKLALEKSGSILRRQKVLADVRAAKPGEKAPERKVAQVKPTQLTENSSNCATDTSNLFSIMASNLSSVMSLSSSNTSRTTVSTAGSIGNSGAEQVRGAVTLTSNTETMSTLTTTNLTAGGAANAVVTTPVATAPNTSTVTITTVTTTAAVACVTSSSATTSADRTSETVADVRVTVLETGSGGEAERLRATADHQDDARTELSRHGDGIVISTASTVHVVADVRSVRSSDGQNLLSLHTHSSACRASTPAPTVSISRDQPAQSAATPIGENLFARCYATSNSASSQPTTSSTSVTWTSAIMSTSSLDFRWNADRNPSLLTQRSNSSCLDQSYEQITDSGLHLSLDPSPVKSPETKSRRKLKSPNKGKTRQLKSPKSKRAPTHSSMEDKTLDAIVEKVCSAGVVGNRSGAMDDIVRRMTSQCVISVNDNSESSVTNAPNKETSAALCTADGVKNDASCIPVSAKAGGATAADNRVKEGTVVTSPNSKPHVTLAAATNSAPNDISMPKDIHSQMPSSTCKSHVRHAVDASNVDASASEQSTAAAEQAVSVAASSPRDNHNNRSTSSDSIVTKQQQVSLDNASETCDASPGLSSRIRLVDRSDHTAAMETQPAHLKYRITSCSTNQPDTTCKSSVTRKLITEFSDVGMSSDFEHLLPVHNVEESVQGDAGRNVAAAVASSARLSDTATAGKEPDKTCAVYVTESQSRDQRTTCLEIDPKSSEPLSTAPVNKSATPAEQRAAQKRRSRIQHQRRAAERNRASLVEKSAVSRKQEVGASVEQKTGVPVEHTIPTPVKQDTTLHRTTPQKIMPLQNTITPEALQQKKVTQVNVPLNTTITNKSPGAIKDLTSQHQQQHQSHTVPTTSPKRRSRRQVQHKFITRPGEEKSDVIYQLLDDDAGIEEVFDFMQTPEFKYDIVNTATREFKDANTENVKSENVERMAGVNTTASESVKHASLPVPETNVSSADSNNSTIGSCSVSSVSAKDYVSDSSDDDVAADDDGDLVVVPNRLNRSVDSDASSQSASSNQNKRWGHTYKSLADRLLRQNSSTTNADVGNSLVLPAKIPEPSTVNEGTRFADEKMEDLNTVNNSTAKAPGSVQKKSSSLLQQSTNYRTFQRSKSMPGDFDSKSELKDVTGNKINSGSGGDKAAVGGVKSISDILKEWAEKEQFEREENSRQFTSQLPVAPSTANVSNSSAARKSFADFDDSGDLSGYSEKLNLTLDVPDKPVDQDRAQRATASDISSSSPNNVGHVGDASDEFNATADVSAGVCETPATTADLSAGVDKTLTPDKKVSRLSTRVSPTVLPATVDVTAATCAATTDRLPVVRAVQTGNGEARTTTSAEEDDCVVIKTEKPDNSDGGTGWTKSRRFDRSVFMPTSDASQRYIDESSDCYLTHVTVTHARTPVDLADLEAQQRNRRKLFERYDMSTDIKQVRTQPHHVIPPDTDIRIEKLKTGQSWKTHYFEHKRSACKMPAKLIPRAEKEPQNLVISVPEKFIKSDVAVSHVALRKAPVTSRDRNATSGDRHTLDRNATSKDRDATSRDRIAKSRDRNAKSRDDHATSGDRNATPGNCNATSANSSDQKGLRSEANASTSSCNAPSGNDVIEGGGDRSVLTPAEIIARKLQRQQTASEVAKTLAPATGKVAPTQTQAADGIKAKAVGVKRALPATVTSTEHASKRRSMDDIQQHLSDVTRRKSSAEMPSHWIADGGSSGGVTVFVNKALDASSTATGSSRSPAIAKDHNLKMTSPNVSVFKDITAAATSKSLSQCSSAQPSENSTPDIVIKTEKKDSPSRELHIADVTSHAALPDTTLSVSSARSDLQDALCGLSATDTILSLSSARSDLQKTLNTAASMKRHRTASDAGSGRQAANKSTGFLNIADMLQQRLNSDRQQQQPHVTSPHMTSPHVITIAAAVTAPTTSTTSVAVASRAPAVAEVKVVSHVSTTTGSAAMATTARSASFESEFSKFVTSQPRVVDCVSKGKSRSQRAAPAAGQVTRAPDVSTTLPWWVRAPEEAAVVTATANSASATSVKTAAAVQSKPTASKPGMVFVNSSGLEERVMSHGMTSACVRVSPPVYSSAGRINVDRSNAHVAATSDVSCAGPSMIDNVIGLRPIVIAPIENSGDHALQNADVASRLLAQISYKHVRYSSILPSNSSAAPVSTANAIPDANLVRLMTPAGHTSSTARTAPPTVRYQLLHARHLQQQQKAVASAVATSDPVTTEHMQPYALFPLPGATSSVSNPAYFSLVNRPIGMTKDGNVVTANMVRNSGSQIVITSPAAGVRAPASVTGASIPRVIHVRSSRATVPSSSASGFVTTANTTPVVAAPAQIVFASGGGVTTSGVRSPTEPLPVPRFKPVADALAKSIRYVSSKRKDVSNVISFARMMRQNEKRLAAAKPSSQTPFSDYDVVSSESPNTSFDPDTGLPSDLEAVPKVVMEPVSAASDTVTSSLWKSATRQQVLAAKRRERRLQDIGYRSPGSIAAEHAAKHHSRKTAICVDDDDGDDDGDDDDVKAAGCGGLVDELSKRYNMADVLERLANEDRILSPIADLASPDDDNIDSHFIASPDLLFNDLLVERSQLPASVANRRCFRSSSDGTETTRSDESVGLNRNLDGPADTGNKASGKAKRRRRSVSSQRSPKSSPPKKAARSLASYTSEVTGTTTTQSRARTNSHDHASSVVVKTEPGVDLDIDRATSSSQRRRASSSVSSVPSSSGQVSAAVPVQIKQEHELDFRHAQPSVAPPASKLYRSRDHMSTDQRKHPEFPLPPKQRPTVRKSGRPFAKRGRKKKGGQQQRKCRTKGELLDLERAREAARQRRLQKAAERRANQMARFSAGVNNPDGNTAAQETSAPAEATASASSTADHHTRKSPLKRPAAATFTSPPQPEVTGPKPKRNRMLEQLKSSAGYIADREKRNETLLKDRRQLNREERHLQRALMDIAQMEQASQLEQTRQQQQQDELRRTKIKRNQQKHVNALKKKAVQRSNKVSKRSFQDFKPVVLESRTRFHDTAAVFKREVKLQQQKSSYLDTTVQRLQAHMHSSATSHEPSSSASDWSKMGQHERAIIDGRLAKVVVPKLSPELHGLAGARLSGCRATAASMQPEIGRIKTVRVKSEVLSDEEIIDILSTDDYSAASMSPVVTSSRKRKRYKAASSKKRPPSSSSRFDSPTLTTLDMETESLTTFQQLELLHDRLYKHGTDHNDDDDDDMMSISTTLSVDGLRVRIPAEVKRVHVVRETGETVLHKAARLGLKDVVLWCCQTRYADPGGQDYAGFAPLHESCATGNIEITRTLLAYGADVNVVSSKDGIRPLHDAVQSDDIEMVRLLLSCGADPQLSTFRGLSIWDVAHSPEMQQFLTAYFSELSGDVTQSEPWEFRDFRLDSDDDTDDDDDDVTGQDLFADVPTDDDDDDGGPAVMFECSEHAPVPVYRLKVLENESVGDYVLLLDILQRLRMSKLEFTDQLKLSIYSMPWHRLAAALTSCSYFAAQCSWMPTDERKRKFHVDLVKWDERLQDLIGVNVVSVTSPARMMMMTSSRHHRRHGGTSHDDLMMLPDEQDDDEFMLHFSFSDDDLISLGNSSSHNNHVTTTTTTTTTTAATATLMTSRTATLSNELLPATAAVAAVEAVLGKPKSLQTHDVDARSECVLEQADYDEFENEGETTDTASVHSEAVLEKPKSLQTHDVDARSKCVSERADYREFENEGETTDTASVHSGEFEELPDLALPTVNINCESSNDCTRSVAPAASNGTIQAVTSATPAAPQHQPHARLQRNLFDQIEIKSELTSPLSHNGNESQEMSRVDFESGGEVSRQTVIVQPPPPQQPPHQQQQQTQDHVSLPNQQFLRRTDFSHISRWLKDKHISVPQSE